MCCAITKKTNMNSHVKKHKSNTKHSIKPRGPRTLPKQKKAVSFGTAQVVVTVTPSSTMPIHERNEIWYPREELTDFREEARNTCRKLKGQNGSKPLLDSQRGLEFRISKERQQQRAMAISITLKAQAHYKTEKDVAMISSKCSARSRHMAMAVGQSDFYSAYFPEMRFDTEKLTLPAFPIAAAVRK